MLGKTRTSDISHTGQRCLFTPHQAFFLRISWPKRVQTVWPQWLFQPWPHFWISPYVWSELSDTIWTGPQAEQAVGLCLSQESFQQSYSPATISSWIKQTVILYCMHSDQEALILH